MALNVAAANVELDVAVGERQRCPRAGEVRRQRALRGRDNRQEDCGCGAGDEPCQYRPQLVDTYLSTKPESTAGRRSAFAAIHPVRYIHCVMRVSLG